MVTAEMDGRTYFERSMLVNNGILEPSVETGGFYREANLMAGLDFFISVDQGAGHLVVLREAFEIGKVLNRV
jgi:hypothetical protein